MTRTLIAASAAALLALGSFPSALSPSAFAQDLDDAADAAAAAASEAAEEIQDSAPPAPPNLDPQPVPAEQRDALLTEIDAYLSELDVLTGSFFQIEPTGVVSPGSFWIDRPGMLRFEYAAPHPFTLISDGGDYYVWDHELEEVNSRVPLRETPLYMFLKRDVALGRDADVLALTETPGELALTLKDRDERVEGTLTLVFARPALELRRFSTTDGSGAESEIVLTDTARDGSVDPALFAVPRERRRERR
jgi:outer membrane lipoprotein-sorting protein